MPLRKLLSKGTSGFCLDTELQIVLSCLHGDLMLLFGVELQKRALRGSAYWVRQGVFSPPSKFKHLTERMRNPFPLAFPLLKNQSFICQELHRTRGFCFSEEKVISVDFVLGVSVRRSCMHVCLCLHVHSCVREGKKNTGMILSSPAFTY